MTFRIKWYRRPSCGIGVVKFKNADDARLGTEIFVYHGYSESEKYSCFGDDTVYLGDMSFCEVTLSVLVFMSPILLIQLLLLAQFIAPCSDTPIDPNASIYLLF
ncbi:unnamed protein product [Strongylus vulgaris]|uniref:Uncharacterized protein n=1 Tax=Strongylus vulgaris TaxID=40348 RepID=A0A3P7ILB5_STRVU|nr:unnamed protein product [Strongylus vulgaris]